MPVSAAQLIGQVSIEGVSTAQASLASVGNAATIASDKLASIKPFNAADAVTDEDVAQAKLTLLEGQVETARQKLLKLTHAADAGEAVTGIPQAQANLTLLQAKAQQARAGLEEIRSGGTAAQEGLQGVDRGTESADQGLQSFLDKLRQTTEQMSSGFAGALRSVGSELTGGGFFSGIASAGKNLLDIGSKIGNTVFGLQNLYQGAVSVGQAFLSPNAAMEQTSTAFKQLLGSSSAAAAELKDLQQFAAQTPFEFPELASSTQKLIAFQIPLKDTKPLLTAIGDALSGLGANTPATLDQVVQVFGQMNAAGKIQTQDLMQLTSVGINGFQILADQMHKPVNVIKDMVTNGTIPAKDGIEALRAGMEKTFGGGMQAQATTFNGLLSTFQDNIGSAWRAFTGPLFDAAKAGLTDMGNLVSSKAFQDFAQNAGVAVMDAFKHIGEAAKFVGEIFHSLNLSDFKQAWMSVSSELGEAGRRLGELISPAKQTGDALQPVTDAIQAILKAGLGAVTDLLWKFSEAFVAIDRIVSKGNFKLPKIDLAPLLDAFKQIGTIAHNLDPVSNLFQQLSSHAQDLGKWFQSSVVPALQDAKPGFDSLGHALQGLLPAFVVISDIVHNTFTAAFNALLPVFERLVPLVIRIAGIIADGLGSAIKFLTPYIIQAAAAIGKFAADIAQRVAPIISQFLQHIQDGLNNFLAVWKAAWPYTSQILKGVWDGIVGVVKIAWALVSGIIKIGLDLLSGNWQQAWTDFKDMLAGVWDGIKTYLSGAWEIIRGIFSGAYAGLRAGASAFWGWLVGMWSGLAGQVSGIAVSLWSNVAGAFRGAWGALSGALSGLWSSITGTLQSWVDNAAQFGSNLIQSIADGVSGAAGAVGDAVHSAIGNALSVAGVHLPGFASGTDFAPGGMAIVGEHGPELMYVPRGAQIIPNEQIGSYASSPSFGSGSPNITVQAPPIYLDGRLLASGLMPYIVDAIRYGVGTHNF